MPAFPATHKAMQHATNTGTGMAARTADVALAVGRSSWWLPVSLQNKRQKISFAEAFKDFLQNLSFHCYGKLVERGRSSQEKLLWFVFHFTALIFLLIFLWNVQFNTERLLSTTVENERYPIRKVAFPALAICPLNRISNTSAMRYAVELNEKDPEMRGIKFFYDFIQLLMYNSFYVNYFFERDSLMTFQNYLDLFDTDEYEIFFNTKKRMRMLAPSCESILLECRLGGKVINCSSEFVETLTPRGFCCGFNTYGKYSVERDYSTRLFGVMNGLTVVLNASTSDFYQISKPGFLVSIYSARNYPDASSGGVREQLILPGVNSFIQIYPHVLSTVDEARILSPSARNCLFADELPHMFGRGYTFNKCMTKCRVRSILILCKCLLYSIPERFLDVRASTVYCTLQHQPCLKRYDFKWLNAITMRKIVPGLEREMEDGLYCSNCLPSCTETTYKIRLSDLPITHYQTTILKSNVSVSTKDLATLNVYFAVSHIPYYNRILKDSWYEVLSVVGNICGIMTGFSIIGMCEVLFFFGKQLYIAFKNEIIFERKRRIKPKEPPLIILP